QLPECRVLETKHAAGLRDARVHQRTLACDEIQLAEKRAHAPPRNPYFVVTGPHDLNFAGADHEEVRGCVARAVEQVSGPHRLLRSERLQLRDHRVGQNRVGRVVAVTCHYSSTPRSFTTRVDTRVSRAASLTSCSITCCSSVPTSRRPSRSTTPRSAR